MTLLDRLAAHLHRPIDESDRERACDHLTDWLACVAGARRTEVAMAARNLPRAIDRAALLGNLLEMDDVHRAARLHPGPVIWPAALMAGGDLWSAAIAGYEAMIAVGATLDDHHYARWHPTATAGLAGAAAAAARGMGLDVGRTADALGLAVSLAGGLWHMRHGNSMTKQVHVLHAATWGVECAWLAAAGLTGARGTLEGEQGWWEASCVSPAPLELRPGWRMAEVSFKPWAACRHAHPAIDAALELGSAEGEVRVETYRDALTFCDRPNPRTAAEARFSLQQSVAVALAHGDARPEHFEPEAIAALSLSRARVSVAEDPAFTDRYPAHFGARVISNGHRIERFDTLGDPERPLRHEQVEAKLQMLCAWGGLGEEGAREALAAVHAGPSAVVDLLEGWTG